MKKLPNQLFRGDADKGNVRLLRSSIRNGQLQTNLISCGYGRAITEQPLVDLINRHVHIGWNKTHFLSFSEDRLTAIRYGLHLGTDINPSIEDEIVDDDEEWDFALFTLEIGELTIIPHRRGVYEGRYNPTLSKFKNHAFVSILLIDVYTVLTEDPHSENFKVAIENAKRDKEWLIFPMTLQQFAPGVIEYSAIMDGGCVEVRTLKY